MRDPDVARTALLGGAQEGRVRGGRRHGRVQSQVPAGQRQTRGQSTVLTLVKPFDLANRTFSEYTFLLRVDSLSRALLVET